MASKPGETCGRTPEEDPLHVTHALHGVMEEIDLGLVAKGAVDSVVEAVGAHPGFRGDRERLRRALYETIAREQELAREEEHASRRERAKEERD